MRNKETGEFELVVGDRQLLSGFFIFALLLGVVFAMGYVVGQNTHSSKAPEAAAAQTPAQPHTRPQPSTPPAPSPDQQPAAEPAAGDAPPQPETEQTAQPAAPPAPTPTTIAAVAPGSYWQVMAVKQVSDTQAMLQTLKDGGMPAFVRKEADDKYHLLVGPYDSTTSGKAKLDLQSKFNCKELYFRRIE